MIERNVYFFCVFLRPFCVLYFWFRSWPHSGQVLGAFRLWRSYLHSRQWMWFEIFLPIWLLMAKARERKSIA